jgi:hypothetical protein
VSADPGYIIDDCLFCVGDREPLDELSGPGARTMAYIMETICPQFGSLQTL